MKFDLQAKTSLADLSSWELDIALRAAQIRFDICALAFAPDVIVKIEKALKILARIPDQWINANKGK